MAHAVKELFPGTKFAIGPAISEGFYYDLDCEHHITQEDLPRIEAKMKEIIKANRPFTRKDMPREQALEYFQERGEIYKVELINEISDGTVSVYEEGNFTDLCRGPHLESTGKVKAFKLLSIAGAYWRGDEKNKMLQRIYGVSFPSKDELKKHLEFLEEVKKRDHRRLGKELDLFSMNDDIGAGLVLWHPRGATIRRAIENFWLDEHYKAGYQVLYTPHMAGNGLGLLNYPNGGNATAPISGPERCSCFHGRLVFWPSPFIRWRPHLYIVSAFITPKRRSNG